MEKLHPGARWLFRVNFYWFFLIWIIVLFSFSINLIAKGVNMVAFVWVTWLLVFVIIFFVIGEIYARLSYRFWGYEFAKNELKIEKGIIWKTYKSIPYERIQNIDINRGIIARIIGFSSLNIQTAGYSAIQTNRGFQHAEGYIPAVPREEAEKIRDFLIKRIGKKQGL